MESFYFTVASLAFLVLLMVIYFPKKKIKSLENKIYSIIIGSTLFASLVEVFSFILVTNGVDSYSYLYLFTMKILFFGFLAWIYYFTVYIIVITLNSTNKEINMQKLMQSSIIIFIVTLIVVLILPININEVNGMKIPAGLAVNVIYIFAVLCIILMLVVFFKNIKNYKNKKYIPLYLLVVMFLLLVVIQNLFPTLLIVNAVFIFVTFVMYFTIENPDVKMITELNKNRLLVNQANEEKSNFLFLASNQIKEPIKKIQELSHDSEDIKDITDLQEVVKEINNLSHSLSYQVENVMDISTLTNSNIKMIENKYNLSNLIEKVRLQKEKNISDKVDFRVNISKNIPKYLYGASKLLEQIISSILNNAIKYTSDGFIELNVNTITKYDMCRLIIEVADSGQGMSIDKVNDLLMLDEPLLEKEQQRLETGDVDINTIKKIVSKMGGYFTIKSEENRGSEVKIVIDQKMDMEGNIEFDKYLAKEKVLVASNNINFLNSLTKILREHGLDVETSMYANDVLDRVRVHEEFSYIFLDDSLDKRALEVLKELKKNPKFKTKVIVMLDKDTEFIKEHFIEDGFSDYLIKDKLLEEVNRILK